MATAATLVAGHCLPRRPSVVTLPLHGPLNSSPSHHFLSLSTKPRFPSLSLTISALAHLSTPQRQEEEGEIEGEEVAAELEEEQHQESESEPESESEETQRIVSARLPPSLPCPQLSVKEKKELASYAHSLGKKLKSQQVGKSGVTPSVAASFVENLESNELLKIKVHGNCPEEFINVVQQLEKSTGSVAVAQIGRSVILYRPSLSKMKQKEQQSTRKVFKPKPRESSAYPGIQKKEQFSRSSGNPRYRSKRV